MDGELGAHAFCVDTNSDIRRNRESLRAGLPGLTLMSRRQLFRQAEKADVDWGRLTKQVIERRQSLEHKTLWLLGMPVIVSAREAVSATRGVLSCRPGPSPASDQARRYSLGPETAQADEAYSDPTGQRGHGVEQADH